MPRGEKSRGGWSRALPNSVPDYSLGRFLILLARRGAFPPNCLLFIYEINLLSGVNVTFSC